MTGERFGVDEDDIVTIGNAHERFRVTEIVARGLKGLIANMHSVDTKLPRVHVPLVELAIVEKGVLA